MYVIIQMFELPYTKQRTPKYCMLCVTLLTIKPIFKYRSRLLDAVQIFMTCTNFNLLMCFSFFKDSTAGPSGRAV